MRKCPYCAGEIQQTEVFKHCGRDLASPGSPVRTVAQPKTQAFAVSTIVTLGLIAAMASFGCGGERDQQTTSTTDSNKVTTDSNKVVADAVDQYHIAKRSGTPIDQCVQARVVTAAYLQAKDEDNYKIWKETEATDCGAVGMRPQ